MSTTVRSLVSSLVLTAIATLAAGCLTEDATTAPADCRTAPADLWLDATELAGPSGPITQLLVDGDAPVTLDGGVCACTTDACRVQYIEENLGCGICVAFLCDGVRVGGCARCDD